MAHTLFIFVLWLFPFLLSKDVKPDVKPDIKPIVGVEGEIEAAVTHSKQVSK